jgi:hypothetical protein
MVHAHDLLLSNIHGTETLLQLPGLLELTFTRTYTHTEFWRLYYLSCSLVGRTSLLVMVG